jgi:hypothetical protein
VGVFAKGTAVTAKYTPDELRAQIDKMWLRQYPDGPTDQNWILNVGIGAGMLSVAADRIEALEALLHRAAQSFPNDDGWLHEAQSLFDGSADDASGPAMTCPSTGDTGDEP